MATEKPKQADLGQHRVGRVFLQKGRRTWAFPKRCPLEQRKHGGLEIFTWGMSYSKACAVEEYTFLNMLSITLWSMVVRRFMPLHMLSLYPDVLAETKGWDCAGLGVCQNQRGGQRTELPGNERNRRGWRGSSAGGCGRLWSGFTALLILVLRHFLGGSLASQDLLGTQNTLQ